MGAVGRALAPGEGSFGAWHSPSRHGHGHARPRTPPADRVSTARCCEHHEHPEHPSTTAISHPRPTSPPTVPRAPSPAVPAEAPPKRAPPARAMAAQLTGAVCHGIPEAIDGLGTSVSSTVWPCQTGRGRSTVRLFWTSCCSRQVCRVVVRCTVAKPTRQPDKSTLETRTGSAFLCSWDGRYCSIGHGRGHGPTISATPGSACGNALRPPRPCAGMMRDRPDGPRGAGLDPANTPIELETGFATGRGVYI
jgi:hypothetical protein